MSDILSSLNATTISEVSREQLIKVANDYVAVPSMIILYFSMLLIFMVVGLIFVEKSRATFFKIWLFSALLGMVILLLLAFLPLFVNSFVEGVKSLFS